MRYVLFWEILIWKNYEISGATTWKSRAKSYFLQNKGFIETKCLKIQNTEILSIANNNVFGSLWQLRDTKLLGIIYPIFDFTVIGEALVSLARPHWPEQVVIIMCNVWNIRRVGYYFSFQHFKECFHQLWNMWPSLVMMHNYLVMTLLVLQPFFLQCSSQTY